MGGCQNYGPFLGTLHIRCRIIIGIQKGTLTLTTSFQGQWDCKHHGKLTLPGGGGRGWGEGVGGGGEGGGGGRGGGGGGGRGGGEGGGGRGGEGGGGGRGGKGVPS